MRQPQVPEIVACSVELQTAQVLELEQQRVRHVIARLKLVLPDAISRLSKPTLISSA